MDTKFGANVSNRILLNAAKFQGYSLYRFWVIKRKPTGGDGGGGGEVILPIPRHTHRLGLILIILEVYAKRCPKCARISKQKLL